MKLKITVHGVAYEVDVEILDPEEGFPDTNPLPALRHRPQAPATTGQPTAPTRPQADATAGSIISPIAGSLLEIHCKAGDTIEEGKVLVVIEAMKMKTAVPSPGGGRIKAVPVAVGDNVREGQVLVELE